MRKVIIVSVGLAYGNAVAEAAHTIANPSDTDREQVALTANSTGDTGWSPPPIQNTILEGVSYPRPQPENPTITSKSS